MECTICSDSRTASLEKKEQVRHPLDTQIPLDSSAHSGQTDNIVAANLGEAGSMGTSHRPPINGYVDMARYFFMVCQLIAVRSLLCTV